MKTRRFGRTGIEVSELVLGGGWVGGLFIDADEDTRRRALRMALDAGVNWIDTAGDYGGGVSETHLGRLIAELEPGERPGVSTKARLDMGGSETVASQIDRMIDASLERLGTDSVDVYKLHNPVAAESDARRIALREVLGRGGVADTLDRLRGDGRARHVGLTAVGEIGPLVEAVSSGAFDTAQVYYNMLNPSADMPAGADWDGGGFGGLLDACAAQDMGTMNIRVFSAGVLASETRHGREIPVADGPGLDEQARRARLALAALGGEHGDRAQTALRFALANARMSCAVIGFATMGHLETALEACERGPLPEEALERLAPLHESRFAAA